MHDNERNGQSSLVNDLMRAVEEKINLKFSFAGWPFHDDDEVKEAVTMWFASQAVTFYDEGL